MFPFKKILCPTDFSETSLCGVKMAKEMVDRFDSEIVLANVHKPIPELPHPPSAVRVSPVCTVYS